MEKTDTLKLLLEEFRYRHDLIWRLYFRAVLAALTLMAIPIIYVDQLSRSLQNIKLALLFPVIAIIVAVVASWIIYTEIRVMRGVMRAYRSLLTQGMSLKLRAKYDVSSRKIGETSVFTFMAAVLTVSALEIYFLQLR